MIPGLASSTPCIRPTRLSGLAAAPTLGLVLVAVVTSLMATGWMLLGLSLLVVAALTRTGLSLAAQVKALRPWVLLALVVLLVHALTTTEAAAVGQFSWLGVRAGVQALARLGTSLAWMALLTRLKPLDEMVQALRWWLRPLESLGLPTAQLGLVLAVALGTVPKVVSEGRRVQAVLTMRRSCAWKEKKPGRWRRFVDRAAVVVPLMEGLMRRAEALSLSLSSRQGGFQQGLGTPPWWHFLPLLVWIGIVFLLRFFQGAS